MDKAFKCPNCRNTTFSLIPEHISQEDFEGEMHAITCTQCGEGNMYVFADTRDLLEAEAMYLRSQLEEEQE